jgi:hypothetical protein
MNHYEIGWEEIIQRRVDLIRGQLEFEIIRQTTITPPLAGIFRGRIRFLNLFPRACYIELDFIEDMKGLIDKKPNWELSFRAPDPRTTIELVRNDFRIDLWADGSISFTPTTGNSSYDSTGTYLIRPA